MHFSAPPARQGNFDSPSTAFTGEWLYGNGVEVIDSGATTAGQPARGYETIHEISPYFTYHYNNGAGYNRDTASNDGRTGLPTYDINLFQAGQGDMLGFHCNGFVTGQRPGATSFLANPAVSCFNATTEAGQAGTYLNPVEIDLNDQGYDVAGIAFVSNLNRRVSTGTLGSWWAGVRIQSTGPAEIDAAYSASGRMAAFLDATPQMLDPATHAGMVTPCGWRWYANGARGLYHFSATGSEWIAYDCALQGFVIGVKNSATLQITANQVSAIVPEKAAAFAAVNKVAAIRPGASSETGSGASATCASGHVCDDLSGEITLNAGTGTLAAGPILAVDFTWARANPPNCAVELQGSPTFLAPSHTTTARELVLSVGAPLKPSSTYTVDYVCGGV
jgi:hypothetical protein